MKFLLDANITFSAKEVFDDRSDQVLHVDDIGLGEASDDKIIKWAKKHRAILITRDLDFANIFAVPASAHHGIIVMRIPSFYNAALIKRVLRNFMLAIDKSKLKDTLVI